MSTHYLRNEVMSMCDAQQIGGGNKRMGFCGKWSKVFFRSVFSFLSKVLWLKELWARVFFKWDCGTFWEALQKQPEFWGRNENVVFKMEVGVRYFDVWAMIAATAYWVDRVSLSGTCSFFGSSNRQFKSNRERISGRTHYAEPDGRVALHCRTGSLSTTRAWWSLTGIIRSWPSSIEVDWRKNWLFCTRSAGSEWSRCALQLSSFQLVFRRSGRWGPCGNGCRTLCKK